jgi:hypothetical protein
MFSILSRNGNANQNDTEIPPSPIQNGYHQENKPQQELARMQGGKGTLIHCLWEQRLVEPQWKSVRRFLKKLKLELPYDPAILPLCVYIQRNVRMR